ncbi:DUF1003 domain-containing protein [Ensifer soli]|uniref:DUF1003 domain-containing protein n=1 Tax=Ciceribacter sp. sgz301302 TaxID=3342379 RepID=UPI0035B7716E
MRTFNEAAKAIFGKSGETLGETERHVLDRVREKRPVSVDTNVAFSAGQTFGARLADGIARVGGSWGFIIGFLLFLVLWTGINTVLLTADAFDPYPFIFLNLLLSMIAAIQAPIIMMSQNRQAARDRFEASKDYEVNLKAEVELIALHHKIDGVLLKEIAELRNEILRLHARLDPQAGQDAGRQDREP